MFTSTTGRAPRLISGTRLRRITAALAAAAGGVLAWAAAIPVASAAIPVPGPGGQYGPAGVTPVPGTGIRVIAADGMAGWQVALIAASTAVVTATLAVYLDRHAVRPARRPGADPACPAARTPDASLVPAARASGTADIVEFGRNLTR